MLKRLQLHEQCQLHDLSQVIDHLARHCFAPDGSLVSKSTYYDLQLAKEEMCRERLRYLETMAIYGEAIAMVEDYNQGWGPSSGSSRIQTMSFDPKSEIEARLKAKCDKLADAFVMEDISLSFFPSLVTD